MAPPFGEFFTPRRGGRWEIGFGLFLLIAAGRFIAETLVR